MSRPRSELRFAVFVSGHGYGHLTRTATLLSALLRRRSVRLTVVTGAPSSLWPRDLSPYTDDWLSVPCDAGVVQTDDLSVDAVATRVATTAWLAGAGAARERLQRELLDRGGVDCIVGDVPPVAFEIARELDVPSIAIANFSWDWIYRELGLADAAAAARSAYEGATVLLELEPATPMPAFSRRIQGGVVGRRATVNPEATRRTLGIAPCDRCVLLALRPAALERIGLPKPRMGLRYLTPTPVGGNRRDVTSLGSDVTFIDSLAAADLVVAKTGYSIVADCAANGAPLLWVRREGFPEDAYLARWLLKQPWAAEIGVVGLTSGDWIADLEAMLARPRPPRPTNDLAARAAAILDEQIDQLLE